jgi:hypothetical protein
MKIIAYFLIVGSLLGLVVTDIVIESKVKEQKLNQEMFETPEGRTLILSYLESKDAALELKTVTSMAFLLLFGSGIAILFIIRVKKIEKRLDRLERE